MKIAVTLFRYFPHGGMQRDALAIAEGLAERGHDVAMLARQWQGKQPQGVAVREVAAPGWSSRARNRAFAQATSQIVAAEGFDFVLGFDRMPGLDAYFAADRCYADRIAARGAWAKLLPGARQRLAMERAVYGPESGTEILLLVEPARAIAQRHYATPEARLHVLPPILPPRPRPRPWPRAKRAEFRRALGYKPDTLALLFVAARFHTKGLERAIASIDALPTDLRDRVVFQVVGDDSATPYRRMRGGERVVFLGARDDLADLMRAADLLLHPAREEMAGKVLVEAMALGLPVLCSGICGYAPLVARADAGIVLPEPFAQARLDEALARMLPALGAGPWAANGPAFAAREPGFGEGIAVAVDTIDRLAKGKAAR